MPVFTASTTAVPNETSIVRGNVAIVGGFWDASGMTAQAVSTGGTDVLIAGANCNTTASAGGTAHAVVGLKLNFDAAGAASAGSLQITPCADNSLPVSQGNWWAVVRVSGTNPTS